MKEILFLLLAIAGINAATYSYPSKCFFTVTQNNGTWWFVDPNGKPFISKGVDVVNMNADSDRYGVTHFADTIRSKYPNNNGEQWAKDTATRITNWGMNTVGAWSDYSRLYNKSVPYTIALSFAVSWRSASRTPMMFPDVFDAGFAENSVKVVSGLTPYVSDPYLIGYFLDNEMWWGDDWRNQYSIMAMYLNYTGIPGYNRVQTFLKSKYSNIGALNNAWGVSAGSFETLKTQWPYDQTNANFKTDAANFLYEVAYQYFEVSTKALRTMDPNHLVLGAKHISVPHEPVCRAEAHFGDVFSFDSYNIEVPQSTMQRAYDLTGLPSLIAEFAFRAADAGLRNRKGGGGVPVDIDQTARANSFERYVTKAIRSPYLIGLHWFQWVDQPYEGRYSDLEDSNLGLVNVNDVPYDILTRRMRDIYPTLDAIHGVIPNSLPSVCKANLPCPSNCNGNGCCNFATGKCTCNSDHIGDACDTHIGSFTETFSDFATANLRFKNLSDSTNGGFFIHQRALSINSNGLNIGIQTTGCPGDCRDRSAVTSGLASTRNHEYGRFDFTIKMPSSSIPLTITWQNVVWGNGDGLQISISGQSRAMQIQRWKDATSGSDVQYSSAQLPFDPASDFHTYSLVKPRVTSGAPYYEIYADSTLLVRITTFVPVAPGFIHITPYANPVPSNPATTYLIKQIQFSSSTALTTCTASSFTVPTNGFLVSKSNGRYLALDQWNFVLATGATSANGALFRFNATSNGVYSIYAHRSGQYATVDGSNRIIANRATVGGWETFAVTQPQRGYFAFKAAKNSQYISVSPNNYPIADSTVLNDASLFAIVPIQAPTASVPITTAPVIKLFSKGAGAYVSVDASNFLVATVGDVVGATTWNLGHPSTTYYTLQNTASSQYATATSYGNGAVVVDRPWPSVPGWETFTFIAQPNNAYAIQANANSKLLAFQSSGRFIATQANSGVIPDAALFHVAAVPPTGSIAVVSFAISTASNRFTSVKLFSKAAGAYVTVESSFLVARGFTPEAGTTFNIRRPTQHYFTIQNAASSQFAAADNYGNGAVIVNRGYPSIPGWESFTFIAQGNAYAIQASANGQLLALQATGRFIASVPNAGTFPDSALFYVIAA